MTKILITILVIGIAAGGAYLLLNNKAPCEEPLLYKIGFIDSRHNMTEGDLLSLIEEAEAIWEKPIGIDLFKQSERGKLTINLIFDERQEQQIALNRKYEILDKRSNYLESERLELEQKTREYDNKKIEFERRLEEWNSGERTSKVEYDILKQKEDELKVISAELRQLVKDFNKKVADYNAEAQESNNTAGVEQQAGEAYGGDSINIYLLNGNENDKYLIAHEMGHALGIEGHAVTEESLMYYKLPDKVESISYEDIRLINELCELGNSY